MLNSKKQLLFPTSLSAILTYFFIFPKAAMAIVSVPGTTGSSSGSGGKITNPALSDNLQSLSGIEYFRRLLPALVTLAFVIGAIVFFFMLLIGGIRWMTSAGDKASLESARGMIVNALVGIVILFSAFAIVGLVELFFGIDILSLDIGSLFIQ